MGRYRRFRTHEGEEGMPMTKTSGASLNSVGAAHPFATQRRTIRYRRLHEESPRHSLNVCAYVENDPINWVDPLGLQKSDPPIEVCATGYYVNGKCSTRPSDGLNVSSSYFGNTQSGFDTGAFFDSLSQQEFDAYCANDPNCVSTSETQEAVVTGTRPDLYPAKDNQFRIPPPVPGGPFSGCDMFFRVCVSRANEIPNDAEAHNRYLNCRQIAKQCNSAVLSGRYGWVNLPGVGVVLIYRGQSTWFGPDQ